MAESIFQTLKDLTTQGRRIVMASVHCPSSKTCHLFTHLVLLTSGGRVAYNGPCDQDQALEYFAGLKYAYPKNYNPGDFYLSLISAAPGVDPEEERLRMDQLSAAFQASEMRLREPLPTDNKCVSGRELVWAWVSGCRMHACTKACFGCELADADANMHIPAQIQAQELPAGQGLPRQLLDALPHQPLALLPPLHAVRGRSRVAPSCYLGAAP